MSIPGKVLIALLSSLVVSAAATLLAPQYGLLALLIPSSLSAVLAVVLSHRALPVPEALAEPSSRPDAGTTDEGGKRGRRRAAASTGEGKRETGGRSPGNRRTRDQRQKAPERSRDRAASKAAEGIEPPSAGKDAADSPLEDGMVKWFNVTKGYGFIIRGNGEEIFVHHRSVKSSGNDADGRARLDDGAAVRFRVVATDKGPQAEDVEAL
ncbi:MAG: cold shock domain-containing protein [Halieaceae bacterium]|jgi:cold shock CspA family protein|nr:cold shock domain-containing protein [Halieaceae bacterium]